VPESNAASTVHTAPAPAPAKKMIWLFATILPSVMFQSVIDFTVQATWCIPNKFENNFPSGRQQPNQFMIAFTGLLVSKRNTFGGKQYSRNLADFLSAKFAAGPS
jgi:hypothetical protein